jgi:hypothetical protein
MTPHRLHECLAIIRWGPATLAQSLNGNSALVDQWLDGSAEVPTKVASWLEALSFTHEAAELTKPSLEAQEDEANPVTAARLEHVPVYAYNLLRAVTLGPIRLAALFGTDDEAAVVFLVSRGLAERDGRNLGVTPAGRKQRLYSTKLNTD